MLFSSIINKLEYKILAGDPESCEVLSICRDSRMIADRGLFVCVKGAVNDGHRYAQMAYENGCRLVTHLYSCTSTITRHGGFRRLGVIESTYLLDGMYAEAIADGCHLPADLLKLIIKLKGADRVCLITDAIRFGGVNATAPLLGGTQSMPYIIEDGVAKLADRSAFAGSIATTEDLLQRSVKAGIALADVVKMMTQTPAEAIGLSSKGRIVPGYDAQFTVFDSDLNIRNEFSNCCL